MVRVAGLEPVQYCYHQNLNLARLPIPPYPHFYSIASYYIIKNLTCQQKQIVYGAFLFLKRQFPVS